MALKYCEVFMSEKNYFFCSVTELLVLSLLEHKDRYVYEIVKSIEDNSEGVFSVSMNSLYTTTYRLEDEGYICEYSKKVGRKRTRVYYHLEKKGEKHLDALRKEYDRNRKAVNNIISAR